MEHLDPPSSQIKVGKILDYFGVMRVSSKQAISTALSVLPGIRAKGPVIIYRPGGYLGLNEVKFSRSPTLNVI